MRRIAVTNQKGGVGKTTTTANLATALAQRKQRVLVLDLDPQAHLTTHLGIDGSSALGTYELLTESAALASDMLQTAESGMSVIPTRMDLAAAESELISVVGREVILRDKLAELNDRFDWLLIDCPPSFGVLTLNALSTVDEVLVPLQAHFLALQGVSRLLETVDLVAKRINASLKVAGFVLCMYEGGTKLATEVVEDLKRFLADARDQPVAWRAAKVFDSRIRRNIKLAECPSYGQSIFAYAPKSHGAEDYIALADELAGKGTDSAATDCGSRIADRGLKTDERITTVKAAPKPSAAPRIAAIEASDAPVIAAKPAQPQVAERVPKPRKPRPAKPKPASPAEPNSTATDQPEVANEQGTKNREPETNPSLGTEHSALGTSSSDPQSLPPVIVAQ